MRKSRVLFCSVSAALLLSLTACGVTITAVHLPDEVQVNVGATAETAATYESKQEADAAAQQAAADKINWTWEVSDDTIATVDGSGVVTGVKGGSTLVTVTSADGKFSASCPVTVSQPLQGIALSNIDLVINRTDNAEISCTLTPADTTDTDITYEIADNSIAKLNGSKVVAVGNGTTTLTAACGKIKANAQITVTTAPTEIQFDSIEGVLTVGNTHTIEATLLPETTTDTDLVWSVCNESIATVDEHGTVTAQGPGSCVVTAATPDGTLKATYALTVKAKQTATTTSNAGTAGATSPGYSAPAQTVTPGAPAEAPAPAPDPEPATSEPSQPSGDSSNSNGDSNIVYGTVIDPNATPGSGIDWTQDESNMSNDIDFDN
ncbi:Ig-like domain-containing protein [Gemmiger sp.]